jgi:hypothetical protein
VAEAKIKITADTSQATRDIERLDKSLENLKSVSGDAAKALALITGAAAAMGYAIKSTLDAAGALVDASNRLGVSAQNLNALQQAARLAGVDAETLNMSLQRLNRSIGEGLMKSTSGSAQAMKTLGLPMQEIARLKPDEQFTRITEALAKMENPAQRNATAFELFGKQAPAILQVANEIEKVNKLINETGFLVTQEDIIALDEASDSIDQLGILWDAGIKKAVAEIAPYIVGFVIRLKEAIKEAGGFEGIFKRVKEIVHTVANIIAIMAAIMATRMVIATAQFAIQMGRAALAAKSFSLFLSRTPIGLLSAGVAILADKIGIDLVGGLGEANGLQDTYKLGQDAINAALDESNKKLNETGEVIQGITEDQKKLQASFTDAVKNSALDLEYQKDILAVGKDQADINKIINDHKQKHLDAGIEINVEEEKKLRANMAQSQSLQKQNELLTQQKQLIEGYINAQRPGEKLVQDIENLRRTLSGEPIIVPIRIETQDDMTANANKALEVAKRQAGEFADSAVAQYSKLYGEAFQITNDYNKAVRELDDALLAARAAGGEQELARVQAIEEAKLAVQENAQRRRMEMEIARFENATKLNDLQIDLDATRHAESLRNQKDIFGNAMFNQKQLMEIAKERADFEKKTELEKTQFGLQQAATLFGALGAHNKKAFEAAKAFNIANAIMNTYTAATKALATYPFPFGLIAAAAAVAAGLAQVAQIRSQQYSGRALGGPVMGGKTYMVGESGPELFTPSTTGSITRNSDLQGGNVTNVNFTIVANDTTGFDQLLASRKGVIQQIISDAMLEKGRRSMV